MRNADRLIRVFIRCQYNKREIFNSCYRKGKNILLVNLRELDESLLLLDKNQHLLLFLDNYDNKLGRFSKG